MGCIRYEVEDPNGTVYRNDNPSGNGEWEHFRILAAGHPDARDPADPTVADFQLPTPTLPSGLWKVRIIGMDMANTNKVFTQVASCSQREISQDPIIIDFTCPPPRPVLGDTVFFDQNGNGTLDLGEPGIAGVLVNVFADPANPAVAWYVSGDPSQPGFANCRQFITGLDEDGLYCFGLPAGTYTVEIADSNFLPGGPLDGMFSTTGGEQQTGAIVDANVLTFDFGYTFQPPGAPGTGTPGYWRNHAEHWPVTEVEIGGVVYSQSEALEILGRPSRGDKSIDLAAQLVGAKLNVLDGNAWFCIADTTAAADVWMAAHPPGSEVRGPSPFWRDEGQLLHNELESYNEGLLCAFARG